MKKSTVIRVGIILVIILVLVVTMLLVDVNLVLEGRTPMFSVTKAVYEDGGTVEYMGFGYKIFKYNKLDEKPTLKFGTLFLQYE